MDEKHPGVDAERMSGRADELIHGRGPESARESKTRPPAPDLPPAPDAYAPPPYAGELSTGGAERAAVVRSESSQPRRDDSNDGDADSVRTQHIRATIEETREEMAQTISAIQERVSPTNVASRVVETMRDDVREKADLWANSDTGRYVRSHPMLSAAMVAGGGATIGWLLFGRRPRRRGYRRPLRPIHEHDATAGSDLTRGRYDAGAEYRTQNSEQGGDWGGTTVGGTTAGGTTLDGTTLGGTTPSGTTPSGITASSNAALDATMPPQVNAAVEASRGRSLERQREDRLRLSGFTVALLAGAAVAALRRARDEMNQACDLSEDTSMSLESAQDSEGLHDATRPLP